MSLEWTCLTALLYSILSLICPAFPWKTCVGGGSRRQRSAAAAAVRNRPMLTHPCSRTLSAFENVGLVHERVIDCSLADCPRHVSPLGFFLH